MSKNRYNESKYNSVDVNPCIKERKLSLKCLDDNDYKHEMCQLYFDNYNNCQKFWKTIAAQRQREGISPYLPEPQERDRIKAEYLKKMKG